MPSAASAKPEKAPTAEGSGVPPPVVGPADNSPVRQILVIIEHKIRNLEKRKSKLISYRDLQKSGKELNADQKVAVAKYDEVVQTLEFARDMCRQVVAVATSAERDAKKQAKKDAWVRAATETARVRDVLLVQDCLVQMGSAPARDDFLAGSNGAALLTHRDLDVLDQLYPEVTPRHELTAEGASAFAAQAMKAAEHLNSIVDGKTKEILGTTYAHIKQIVTTVHECGYFDKSEVELEEQPIEEPLAEEPQPEPEVELEAPPAPQIVYAEPVPVPLPTVPVPTPTPAAYPLRPLPPITLQEVEHAYFTQQYAQQRPITDVIGSQNFFFLQESEIDSPGATLQPPPEVSPPGPIPTQTFTNQNFIPMAGRVAPEPGVVPPQPHFPPPGDIAAYAAPLPAPPRVLLERLMPQAAQMPPAPPVVLHTSPTLPEEPSSPTVEPVAPAPPDCDDWTESPEGEESDRPRAQGEGDGQNLRYRKFRGPPRGQNGYRGRGGYRGDSYQGDGYQGRQNDGYQGRQNNGGYQGRPREEYQGRREDRGPREDNRGPREDRRPRDDNRGPREDNRGPRDDNRGPREANRGPREDYRGPRDDNRSAKEDNRAPREDNRAPREDNRAPREDNRAPREDNRGPRDYYRGPRNDYRSTKDDYRGLKEEQYRNGDNGHQTDSGSRDKYDNPQGYQGFKGRGRGGGGRGVARGGPPRSSRPPPHFARKEAQQAE